MKLVLYLCLALFAASAFAEVAELPESTQTESVEPADMEFLEASFEDAKQTVTGLMQAGKKDQACKDLADASKREVTDSVAASQKAVNAMPNGSQCKDEGKDLISQAESDLTKAKAAVSDAQNKINAAKAVKINFGDMVVSSLDGKKCSNFYNSLVYTNAKKKIKDAETHYTKKVAEKDAAVKAVASAKREAERLVRHCQCASKRAIEKAVKDFNSKSAAMNKATWTKAYHMECVLAGKTAAGCSVPTVPSVKMVPLSSSVANACSTSSNWIGCFTDNSSRDFKHGPQRYGYNPTSCMQKCKQYKFIALQDGGWCQCDNTYGTPASTYTKRPDGECNKGGKGQGGPWRNAVYSNVDWQKAGLCCSRSTKSTKNAGWTHATNPGKCAHAQVTGGGMSQSLGWGKLGAIERFFPDGKQFTCDTGFGAGHLTCFGVYCSKGNSALTCQTKSVRVNRKSGGGFATLDAGYVMTGGGLVTHYSTWDKHAQFEVSAPHGQDSWLADMGFGWGDFTAYVTGCKGLKCVTATSKNSGDMTEAKCPSGYQVTGCGMRNNHLKFDKGAAFEQMEPSSDLSKCMCNMGIGKGNDKCFARCCKLA